MTYGVGYSSGCLAFLYSAKHGTCFRTLSFMGLPAYRIGDDGSAWTRLAWTKKGIKKTDVPVYYLSTKWKRLKGWSAGCGYLMVGLRDANHNTIKMYLHTLALLAFHGPAPSSEMNMCRHFPDKNKVNNSISNIQWGTRKQNAADCSVQGIRLGANKGYRKGVPCPWNQGESSSRAKLTAKKVLNIRKDRSEGMMYKDLAQKYGVSTSCIWAILCGHNWTHI